MVITLKEEIPNLFTEYFLTQAKSGFGDCIYFQQSGWNLLCFDKYSDIAPNVFD